MAGRFFYALFFPGFLNVKEHGSGKFLPDYWGFQERLINGVKFVNGLEEKRIAA